MESIIILSNSNSSEVIYNSFAGADIVAQIILPNEAPLILGELSTISWSIHRENSPVRILGHVNPIGFVHGPRTVAGSMIFTVFNQYAFYRLAKYKENLQQGLYPLADMLPLFDIAISFSSEYGAMSQMRIYGITIVDEGQTMSVDDLITEATYTYMAQGVVPMTVSSSDLVSSNYLDMSAHYQSNTWQVPLQTYNGPSIE